MMVWDGSRIDGEGSGLRWPCWDAEGGTRRTKRRPRSGWREVLLGRSVGRWVRVGSVGPLPAGSSDRVWNRLQSGEGATELGFPGPALGKMQSEAARRAGEPPGPASDPGRTLHLRHENTRSFPALWPGETNPPERAKESAMQRWDTPRRRGSARPVPARERHWLGHPGWTGAGIQTAARPGRQPKNPAGAGVSPLKREGATCRQLRVEEVPDTDT